MPRNPPANSVVQPRSKSTSGGTETVGTLLNKPDLTLDEYVRLCRAAPALHRRLFLEDDEALADLLDDAGKHVDQRLFENLLKDDDRRRDHDDVVSDLHEASLQIMEAIAKGAAIGRKVGARVRLGGAIPESLANELTCRLVDLLADADEDDERAPVPHALAALVRFRLRPEGKTKRQTDPRHSTKKKIAAMKLAENPSASSREVAKAIGVAHTTIEAWRREPGFKEQVHSAPKVKNIRRLKLK